jgi:hypothetical protein
MFSGLFARPNPRVAALDAMRKMYVAQVNGYAGDSTEAIIAAERHVWGKVMSAFQIDATRGAKANLGRINDLIETCHSMSRRFDFAGVVVPTLIHNSGFDALDQAVLSRHLSGAELPGKPSRKGPAANAKHHLNAAVA